MEESLPVENYSNKIKKYSKGKKTKGIREVS